MPREDNEEDCRGTMNDQDNDKDLAIPTTVTIKTITATTTAISEALAHPEEDGKNDKPCMEYNNNNATEEDVEDEEEHSEYDDSGKDDDSDSWEYDDDMEDYDADDSVVQLFKVSQRPRFLRFRNKDMYLRDDSDITDVVSVDPKHRQT